MISEMLRKENIQILDHIDDWKEAVHISMKPLEDKGYVETALCGRKLSEIQKRSVGLIF